MQTLTSLNDKNFESEAISDYDYQIKLDVSVFYSLCGKFDSIQYGTLYYTKGAALALPF